MINRKSIKAIENIITNINELDIMTKDRNDLYFYDSYEMLVLCDLVSNIEKNLSNISLKIKKKYKNVNWNIIKEQYNEFDELKVGKIWILSSGLLKGELLSKLKKILIEELPIYYTNYCNKQHGKYFKKDQ